MPGRPGIARTSPRHLLPVGGLGQNRPMRIPVPLLVVALVTPPAPVAAEPLPDAVRRFAEQQTRGLGDQVTIDVPPLDARSRVGECPSPEIFLPHGSRLWGRTHLGVRCSAPAWLVYVPVHIKVRGHFLVSKEKMSAGRILTDADFSLAEGELTALPDGVLGSPDQARGQKLRVAVAPGAPLRRDHLQRTPVVRQGQVVRIVVRGKDFTVSSEGVALNNGYEGEPVRVKNAAGKSVQGKATAAGTVELAP